MICSGRIIEEQKNYLIINTESGNIRAVLKGTLKKERVRALVGDLVDLEITNKDSLEGIITQIHDRTCALNRPSISNITQIVFVVSYKEPSIDLESLDRYLFSAEVNEMKPVLVFNKIDLLSDEDFSELEKIVNVYRGIGYPTLFTSAKTGLGIQQLIEKCKNQITAFAGLSGVGKSSLLSAIFPQKEIKVGNLSLATGRGSHTTTNAYLLPLEGGGYIADTPGQSLVKIPSVPQDTVCSYFPEIAAHIGECRFNNCIHDGEPGCVIEELIKKGEIASFRMQHFLKFHHAMKNSAKY